jgi:hypothetical protein
MKFSIEVFCDAKRNKKNAGFINIFTLCPQKKNMKGEAFFCAVVKEPKRYQFCGWIFCCCYFALVAKLFVFRGKLSKGKSSLGSMKCGEPQKYIKRFN